MHCPFCRHGDSRVVDSRTADDGTTIYTLRAEWTANTEDDFAQYGVGIARTFEGSSLETIRHMVASGIGITVLPKASVPDMQAHDGLLRYVPFEDPVPTRRVVIAWRKSFTRRAAIEAVRDAMLACDLHGVTLLEDAPVEEG